MKLHNKKGLARLKFPAGNLGGFTLIELLVVIAIIGILSTLAVVSLGSARIRARDSKRVADMRSLQSALEVFYTDRGTYPVLATAGNIEEMYLCNTAGVTAFSPSPCAPPANQLMRVAKDPVAAQVYTYTSATGTTYSVAFTLEQAVGELALGTNCLTPGGMASGACP